MNDINFNLEDFIGIYENCVPDKVCDDLIVHFEKTVSYGLVDLNDGKKHYNRNEVFKHDENLNLTKTLFVSLEDHDIELQKVLIESMNTAFKHYCSRYSTAFMEISQNGFVNRHFKMQKTEPTQGYHVWHSELPWNPEHQISATRQIVWGLYLNDVEEGGETEFLYQSQRISPKKGCLVVWPAGWTHTHRGNPPLSDTKYIVTGWLTEGNLKPQNF